MCGFIRMRKLPVCRECNREIIDDLCLVFDKENDFESCICLDCRDKAQRLLNNLPHIQETALEALDSKLDATPSRDIDVISTSFARLLA